jgi:hypothetical protein
MPSACSSCSKVSFCSSDSAWSAFSALRSARRLPSIAREDLLRDAAGFGRFLLEFLQIVDVRLAVLARLAHDLVHALVQLVSAGEIALHPVGVEAVAARPRGWRCFVHGAAFVRLSVVVASGASLTTFRQPRPPKPRSREQQAHQARRLLS